MLSSVQVHDKNFKKNALKYVSHAINFNEPVSVVTEKGNAVIVSEETFRSISETLYLKNIPGMEKRLLDALDEGSEEFNWREELG